MAVAKEHVVTALSLEIMPDALEIRTEPVAMERYFSHYDLVNRTAADCGGGDWPGKGISGARIARHMLDSE